DHQQSGPLVQFVLDLRALGNLDVGREPLREVFGQRDVVPGVRAHDRSSGRASLLSARSAASATAARAIRLASPEPSDYLEAGSPGKGHRGRARKVSFCPALAMLNPAHQKGPLTPGERNFVFLFAALVLGLFVAEIARDYQPVKLT